MSSDDKPLAVTDTHALILAIDGKRKRLGKQARRFFDRADEGKCAIYIPAQALAELGEACHADRVRLDLPFEATAVVLDLPLITRDPEIQRAAGIECIWS